MDDHMLSFSLQNAGNDIIAGASFPVSRETVSNLNDMLVRHLTETEDETTWAEWVAEVEHEPVDYSAGIVMFLELTDSFKVESFTLDQVDLFFGVEVDRAKVGRALKEHGYFAQRVTINGRKTRVYSKAKNVPVEESKDDSPPNNVVISTPKENVIDNPKALIEPFLKRFRDSWTCGDKTCNVCH